MFIHNQSMQLEEERRRDLRRELEKRALVRQALAARAGRDRNNQFPRRALTWLGGQLIIWGQWLQTHYAPQTKKCSMPVAKKL